MTIAAVPPFVLRSVPNENQDTTTLTLDAAGESGALVGQVWIQGAAASKVLSSSGGKIYYRTGAGVTFANGGTNLRIGVQDVATTGLEDTTFDTYADLVGGVATITSSAYNVATIGTGSKTIAHGDLIAIVAELTTRAGADAVVLRKSALGLQMGLTSTPHPTIFPYGTQDTGALTPTATSFPWFVLQFDDGTLGWIFPAGTLTVFATSSIAFNSGSTPDEYINSFQVPVPVQISGIGLQTGNIATSDTYEVILYSDPYGTPAVVQTLTPDTDQIGTTGAGPNVALYRCTPVTLQPGTVYGVALRPTSANNISIYYMALPSGYDGLKNLAQFFSAMKLASRTNQTGAFTETNAFDVPFFYLIASGFDDGAGSGGGLLRHPGMKGGLNA